MVKIKYKIPTKKERRQKILDDMMRAHKKKHEHVLFAAVLGFIFSMIINIFFSEYMVAIILALQGD